MICKFCGLNNPDDAAHCSRCGTPLKEGGQMPSYSAQPVSDVEKKTMRLNRQMPSAQEPASAPSAPMEPMVHECGYPLLPGTQVCPNCHKPVNVPVSAAPTPVDDSKKTMRMPVGQTPAAPQVNKQTVRDYEVRYQDRPVSNQRLTVKDVLHVKDADSQSEQVDKRTVMVSRNAVKDEVPVNKATINPFAMPKGQKPQEEPVPETFYCALKPSSRTEEPESMLVKQEFETPQVVLNRENTEPGNMSITSREQAVLTCENGQWFIEDHSSLKTTFVYVSRKMPLQDGDVVLMGDREFVFSTKKEQ